MRASGACQIRFLTISLSKSYTSALMRDRFEPSIPHPLEAKGLVLAPNPEAEFLETLFNMNIPQKPVKIILDEHNLSVINSDEELRGELQRMSGGYNLVGYYHDELNAFFLANQQGPEFETGPYHENMHAYLAQVFPGFRQTRNETHQRVEGLQRLIEREGEKEDLKTEQMRLKRQVFISLTVEEGICEWAGIEATLFRRGIRGPHIRWQMHLNAVRRAFDLAETYEEVWRYAAGHSHITRKMRMQRPRYFLRTLREILERLPDTFDELVTGRPKVQDFSEIGPAM